MNHDKTNQSMSLSQAIRLGAMLHPPAFEAMFTRQDDVIVATCAMAAAAMALGEDGANPWLAGRRLREEWPILDKRTVLCPYGCRSGDLYVSALFGCSGLIAHLNDDHKLSREAIADFVEQIETTLSHSTNMEAVGVGEKVTR